MFASIRVIGEGGPARTVLRGPGAQLVNVYGGSEVELSSLMLAGGNADNGGAVEVSNDVRLTMEHYISKATRLCGCAAVPSMLMAPPTSSSVGRFSGNR